MNQKALFNLFLVEEFSSSLNNILETKYVILGTL